VEVALCVSNLTTDDHSEAFMTTKFLHSTLGRTGREVFRLGLSASYRPGRPAIRAALDRGVNYLFAYGFDNQMFKTLREVFPTRRDQLIIATGGYNWILWHSNMRKVLEKRLRQLGSEYLDVFMFLGVMKPQQFPDRVYDEMVRLREEGKVRAIGISTHDRKFAGELAARGALDVLMIRYNAAHRGAETDIFPHLAAHGPGLVSYTATRWSYLLRRTKGWPKDKPIPTPGMAYRFVLSNPHVDVVLTAPYNARQLDENLAEIAKGPLSPEEMTFMRQYGDAVHHTKKWFM
jgi:aryl-alcohol dehydrogenase-like predicted oxidoreductase